MNCLFFRLKDRCAAAALVAVAATCCGCAREPETLDRFVPAPDLARSALEAVLEDWRGGLAPGPIDRLPVKVQITDNQRKPGQQLDDFEILGEVPGATARCFAVRLKLREPVADEKVRYAVFGIDPLWVFRQEDLEMLSHWEHPMPAEDKAAANPAPASVKHLAQPLGESKDSTEPGNERIESHDGEAAVHPTRPPLPPPYEGGEEPRRGLVELGRRANAGAAAACLRFPRSSISLDGDQHEFPPFVRGGWGGLEGAGDFHYPTSTIIETGRIA